MAVVMEGEGGPVAAAQNRDEPTVNLALYVGHWGDSKRQIEIRTNDLG